MTKDPVVIAGEIVLALKTIVSREIEPGTPAVATVAPSTAAPKATS